MFPATHLIPNYAKTGMVRHHLDASVFQRTVHDALVAAGINKHAAVHTLRHSFATHMLEAGAHLHTIQRLLGHKQITSTMVYLHLTHQSTKDALKLMDELCRRLPR